MTQDITTPTPPAITSSITRRRGRKNETQEHDIARFLLTLSSSSALHQEIHGPRGGTRRRSRSDRRVHECSVCPKRFRTGRALGGHMKCHWERDLKGRVVKKKMRKISALGFGLELGRAPPSASDPKPSAFKDEGIEGEEDDVGDSFGEGSSSPPSPLMLPY